MVLISSLWLSQDLGWVSYSLILVYYLWNGDGNSCLFYKLVVGNKWHNICKIFYNKILYKCKNDQFKAFHIKIVSEKLHRLNKLI